MRILLIGTGFQGKAALYDLVQSEIVSQVVAVDPDIGASSQFIEGLASPNLQALQVDAQDTHTMAKLMRDADAVVSLVPFSPLLRLSLVSLALDCGAHWIDSSYTLPEFAELSEKARQADLAILPEFGLDPGIDLVLQSAALTEFDEVHRFMSYGSGVPAPEAANNPLRYKLSWSLAGVLSAYQRPAQIIHEEELVSVHGDDLFAPENVHSVVIDGLGDMEAYPNGNVQKYLEQAGIEKQVRYAGRYALRWPGHADFWYKLVKLGFLSEAPLPGNRLGFSPRKLLCDLLEPQMHYKEDESDLAILRIELSGLKNKKPKHVRYQLIERRDPENGLLAMQRTVGFTSSIGAQMLLSGLIKKRGLLAPMLDVPPKLFFSELAKRKIIIKRKEEGFRHRLGISPLTFP